uniref:Platelet derived growth factor receptor beta n=1 Tax=Anolis carolinensis TaxID=28377 RepID=A0A803SYD3_ANOCA
MLLHLLLKMPIFLFLFLTGLLEINSLKISPNDREVILSLYSDFTLTCSGQNEVFWMKDSKHNIVDTVLEKKGGTFFNTLTLRNVTGFDTGEYSCNYIQPPGGKAIYIFVPDPSLPFLPNTHEETFVFSTGHVEDIIPCRVTDPNTTVTVYEKKVNDPVPGTYYPQQGFKGYFDDTTYICRATIDEQEFDSEQFYIYSIEGEPLLNIPLYHYG